MTEQRKWVRCFPPLSLGVLAAGGLLMLAAHGPADAFPPRAAYEAVQLASGPEPAEPGWLEPAGRTAGPPVVERAPAGAPKAEATSGTPGRRPGADAVGDHDKAMIAALLLSVRSDPKLLTLMMR